MTTAVRVKLGDHVRGMNVNVVLLGAITIVLVLIGLVMVLSSSSVEEYAAGNDSTARFSRQLIFAAVGLPLMLIAASMRAIVWKRVAWWALIAAIIVQSLVFTPLGVATGENLAWIEIGGITMQPAEFTKVALVIWLGLVLERKQTKFNNLREMAVPLVPVLGVTVGILLLGGDLGTIMVIGALVLGAFWFAGVPFRYIFSLMIIAVIGVAAMSLVSPIRMNRISSFYDGTCDYENLCWQTSHGMFALASGGIFGSGLGNSRAKWSWLPAADNDFIFAIIGEELGLIGALVVIGLFAALIIVLLRIYRDVDDMFSKTVVGAVLVWIMFQAFVNIAVVLGLLPVLGVPLPFVSSGGSALIATLLAVGIVMSVARGAKKPESGEKPRKPQPNHKRRPQEQPTR